MDRQSKIQMGSKRRRAENARYEHKSFAGGKGGHYTSSPLRADEWDGQDGTRIKGLGESVTEGEKRSGGMGSHSLRIRQECENRDAYPKK